MTSVGCVEKSERLCGTEYKQCQNNLAIVWELCGKYGLERAGKWYEHKPERIVENGSVNILWDFMV